jgi:predicted amidohydrolase
MTSNRDVDANLALSASMCAEASTRGVAWIVFPENAPFLGKDSEKFEVAQGLDGPMIDAYREMATRHGMWVTVGGFPEATDDPKMTFNTQVMIDASGSIAGVYRKMHLFDAIVDSQTAYKESDHVRPGDDLVMVDMEHAGERFRVGLTICYDLRFPELYRRLRAQGADVVTVPSAFTLQTGRDHWHPLLQARAIENQCWVVAPDQFGHHFGKRWSYGHSVVYDPWGRRVACASDRIGVTYTEIDRELVETVRERMPCENHRRLGVES